VELVLEQNTEAGEQPDEPAHESAVDVALSQPKPWAVRGGDEEVDRSSVDDVQTERAFPAHSSAALS